MNMHLRILLLAGALLFMAVTVYNIRTGNLNLFHSIRWFAGSALILIMAIFPDGLASLAAFCGIEIPSNFVFFIMIAFLLLSSLSLSASASRQHERIRKLVQETAALENRIRELEEAASGSPSAEREK